MLVAARRWRPITKCDPCAVRTPDHSPLRAVEAAVWGIRFITLFQAESAVERLTVRVATRGASPPPGWFTLSQYSRSATGLPASERTMTDSAVNGSSR